jgi:hypothetical protein
VANVIADNRFDRAILRELKSLDPRWIYTRYSDDIDVSHPEVLPREKVYQVIELVRKCVNAAGFEINDNKTGVDFPWNRQKILGIVVNEKPNIPRYEYMHIRCLIHNCMVHGFESQAPRAGKPSVASLVSHIKGKLAYFNQIDKSKADDLRAKLDCAVEIHGVQNIDEVDFGQERTGDGECGE